MAFKKRNEDTHYKVYRYGAHFPVRKSKHCDSAAAEMWKEQAAIFERQMVLSNQFYNALVEVEIANRAEYKEIISGSQEMISAQARLDDAVEAFEETNRAYKEARARTRKRRPDEKLAAEVKKARKARQAAKENRNLARGKAKEEQKEKIEAHNEKFKTLKDEARNNAIVDGLWWATANATMAALPKPQKGTKKSASTRPCNLNKRAIYGDGQVATQIQIHHKPPLYFRVVDQEGWKSTRPGKILHLRVGSTGKQGRIPVWAKIPFLCDRPLPDAPIKWVLVVRKRVGVKYHWSVNFVAELPDQREKVEIIERAACRGRVIAFDLGWRKTVRGLRVGYATDSNGRSYEVLLPPWLVDGWDRVQSLRSIRDKMFDEIRGQLCEWKRGRELPDWMVELLKFAPSWRKQKRLMKVRHEWRTRRFDGDAKMFTAVDAWAKRDLHLYEYERYQERRCINQRRDLYRHWASYLAENYDAIVFEDLDFSELYRKPEIESKASGVIGLHRRASPGLFRSTIEQAFLEASKRAVRVEHQGSSTTCAKCWQPTIDLKKDIKATCAACGVEIDRDCNASRVLLARGGVVTKAPGVLAQVKAPWYQRLMHEPRRVTRGKRRLRAKRSQTRANNVDSATV